jgi:hypothetical protein
MTLCYKQKQKQVLLPPFVDNNGDRNDIVRGRSHRMLADNCGDAQCPWTLGLREREIELAVPLVDAHAALTLVRQHIAGYCIPLQGVWLRVARATANTALAMASGGDRLVIGVTLWAPSPPRTADAVDALAHALTLQLGARPHFAKNAELWRALVPSTINCTSLFDAATTTRFRALSSPPFLNDWLTMFFQ